MRDTDTDGGERAHSWLRVAVVVTLVLLTATAPVLAQTDTATATPASGSDTAICEDGPPIRGQYGDELDTGGNLEVVLVNDISESMSNSDIEEMIDGSNILVNELASEDKAGLVSFGEDTTLVQELTTDKQAVSTAVDGLQRESNSVGTFVDNAITAGQDELLNGTNAEPDAQKVMVLFGDGGADDEQSAIAAAQEAKQNGITVVTVGLGSNEDFYAEMASGEEFAYFAPSNDELENIYGNISTQVGAIGGQLIVETRDLYQHGETHPYTVKEEVLLSNNRTVRNNVTDEASITISNTSLLTADETAHTLSSTADVNQSGWVRVDATYNGSTGCTNVIIAEPTVENLELLPGIWRVSAVAGDSTIFALLIAVLLAVPTTRFTSAFGGLAVGQMVITIGWLGGYVGWAIAAASLFTALFIGLNLAANINYMGGMGGNGGVR